MQLPDIHAVIVVELMDMQDQIAASLTIDHKPLPCSMAHHQPNALKVTAEADHSAISCKNFGLELYSYMHMFLSLSK